MVGGRARAAGLTASQVRCAVCNGHLYCWNRFVEYARTYAVGKISLELLVQVNYVVLGRSIRYCCMMWLSNRLFLFLSWLSFFCHHCLREGKARQDDGKHKRKHKHSRWPPLPPPLPSSYPPLLPEPCFPVVGRIDILPVCFGGTARDIRKALAALARELNDSEAKRLQIEEAFRSAGGGVGIAEVNILHTST